MNRNQMIHIATEVAVLTGLTMYFSAKNRTLLSYVEDLAQRLEAHESIIEEMKNEIDSLRNINRPISKPVNPKIVSKPVNPKIVNKPVNKPTNPKIVNKPVNKPTTKPPQIQKPLSPIQEETEVESTNESDIDKEIADELNELQTNSETENTTIEEVEEDDSVEYEYEDENETQSDLKKSQ